MKQSVMAWGSLTLTGLALALFAKPVQKSVSSTSEVISGILFNATSGRLPPPPARIVGTSDTIKKHNQVVEQLETEYDKYIKIGKHPLALFPPFPEQVTAWNKLHAVG